MKLRFQDNDGARFAWSCNKVGKFWELTDHNGYVRVLEDVWATSVPRILLIAENHGLSPLQNIS